MDGHVHQSVAVVRRPGDRTRPRGPLAVPLLREADTPAGGAQARAPARIPARAARPARVPGPGPAPGRPRTRARPRRDGTTAAARLPPPRQPGLCQRERHLRPRDAAPEARARPGPTDHAG